ncbi:MAG TPA: hypothetical protein VFS43_35235 [Polyangiaceae bacterium]|nr:hypothetical protein [Polyangiaceae bacterium]
MQRQDEVGAAGLGMGREVALAADPTDANALELPYGPDATPAALRCPACRGTLWEIREGEITRYRCQVGHAYSSATLLGAQGRGLEDALSAACRMLEESATFARRMAARAAASDRAAARAQFEAKARRASERAALLRRALSLSTAPPGAGGGAPPEADDVAGGAFDAAPQAAPRPRGPAAGGNDAGAS